jgi:hypothetical protein
MERYTDGHGRTVPVPRGLIELVLDLEWAVEADCAPDRNRRTELRRSEARDALVRFLAGETAEPPISIAM